MAVKNESVCAIAIYTNYRGIIKKSEGNDISFHR